MGSDNSLVLRGLTPEDLPGADKLRAAAGWNQTLQDWERLLSLDAEGCFVAEDQGEIVGSATTTPYGNELAWIGMLLVDPSRRSQGIGRKLFMHCLDYLQKRKMRCIKLDATPAGQVLYEKVGFQVEWSLMRWDRPAGGTIMDNPSPCELSIHRLKTSDWDEVVRLDREVFGVDRRLLLAQLGEDSSHFLVCRGPDETLEGFGLLRAGINAHYMGPLVVRTERAGFRILQQLLVEGSSHRLCWDIPEACSEVRSWAEKQGFTPQRSLIRMFSGNNASPGLPLKQWAISDPATG